MANRQTPARRRRQVPCLNRRWPRKPRAIPQPKNQSVLQLYLRISPKVKGESRETKANDMPQVVKAFTSSARAAKTVHPTLFSLGPAAPTGNRVVELCARRALAVKQKSPRRTRSPEALGVLTSRPSSYFAPTLKPLSNALSLKTISIASSALAFSVLPLQFMQQKPTSTPPTFTVVPSAMSLPL